MRRRDLIKSAAAASAATAVGLGGFSQFSHQAVAAGNGRSGVWFSGLGRSLLQWPLIPIHAVLLSDGRVLTYGTKGDGQQTGYFIYDVWDPNTNYHMTLPNTVMTDIFCSAQIVLPQSGNVLIAGGDNWTGSNTTNTGNADANIFYPGSTPTLGRDVSGMNRPRWYASTMTLPDGRTYIQGGTGGEDRPEIRERGGSFRLLSGADTSSLSFFYPRNRVAPDGRIFGYADLDMYYVDPSANGGSGSLTLLGKMPADGPSGVTSCDVMYAPGKILRCGGGSNNYGEKGGTQTQAKNAAATIDISNGTPVYKKLPSMPKSLHWASATVLADGSVVVTGGSALENQLSGVNTSALLWKPDTGKWTQGAESTSGLARMYHSIALLLPDGSLLSGGGGAPGPQTNLNAEIYYPPYLLTSSGAFAPRPTISSAPAIVGYNQTFKVAVDVPSLIQRVTFIKTGSVTHSCNFEQSFMELPFDIGPYGVSVQAPNNAVLAPPGNYLLFVIDNQGVPSVAKIVQIG